MFDNIRIRVPVRTFPRLRLILDAGRRLRMNRDICSEHKDGGMKLISSESQIYG